ncbi:hypothetical protein RchiOBHm_Chr2g0099411 [Rosa chinensis]|uniref:Transmembrane protein n=1 Tax=Rosa chinensis TaxID=74649 RepID=A0A2P6RLX8_ROSCH|nr:hypothetical protein RchiOBHm_Chr2g0099411 [Rosa chinensis]
MDFRMTQSLRGTSVWGDRQRFHHGCRIEGLQPHATEQGKEDGEGSISTSTKAASFLMAKMCSMWFSVTTDLGWALVFLGCLLGHVWTHCFCCMCIPYGFVCISLD